MSGRTLFFAANDGIHGQELWKSDGTRSGTVLVKDINTVAARDRSRRIGADATEAATPPTIRRTAGG